MPKTVHKPDRPAPAPRALAAAVLAATVLAAVSALADEGIAPAGSTPASASASPPADPFASAVELIGNDQPDVRLSAVRLLGHVGGPRAAEQLATALSDPVRAVREEAVNQLRALGPDANAAVVRLLQSPNPALRLLAVKLLRPSFDHAVVQAYVGALQDRHWRIRYEALQRWKEFRPDAAAALLALCGDPSGMVRQEARGIIAGRRDEADVALMIEALRSGNVRLRRAVAGMLARRGDKAQQALRRAATEDADPLVRQIAAAGDGRPPEPQIPPGHLRDPLSAADRARLRAAQALAAADDPRAVKIYAAAARSGGPALRYEAVKALRDMDTDQCADALAAAMEDPIPLIRHTAAVALAKLADRRAAPVLVQWLDSQDIEQRTFAAGVLGCLRDERAIGPLIEASMDVEPGFRRLAVLSLCWFYGRPEITAALADALLDDETALIAAAVLSDSDSRDAVDALIGALCSKQLLVRMGAIQALCRIGDRRAVQPLARLLQAWDDHTIESNALVRAAADALGRLGDPRAFEPLNRCLRRARAQVAPLTWAMARLAPAQQAAALLPPTDMPTNEAALAIEALATMGPVAVPPLLTVVRNADGAWPQVVRQAAAEALGRLRDPSASDGLLAMLAAPNAVEREAAAVALRHIDEPRAVGPLTAALRDEAGGLSRVAAECLARMSSEAAADALLAAAKDESLPPRLRAAAIGQLPLAGGQAKTVDVLLAAARAPADDAVGEAAGQALRQMWHEDAAERIAAAFAAEKDDLARRRIRAALLDVAGDAQAAAVIQALGERPSPNESAGAGRYPGARPAHSQALDRLGPGATAALLDAAAAGRTEPELLAALGRTYDPRAVEPLLRVAERKGSPAAVEAVIALGRLGNRKAVKPLIELLKSPDVAVRAAAAGALGRIGDPAAAEPLIGLLGEKQDSELRRAAARALAAVRDPRAAEPLSGILADTSAVPALRADAADALAELGDAKAVLPLIDALSADEPLATAAAFALAKLRDERAVAPLRAALKDRPRWPVAAALIEIDGVEGVQAVLPRLFDYGQDEFLDLCRRIVRLRGEPLSAMLLKKTYDRDVRVRRAATQLLGFVGHDQDAVAARIEQLARQRAEGVHETAAVSLGLLGDARARPFLEGMLRDADEHTCMSAEFALGVLDDAESAAALAGALHDSRPPVRAAAVRALGHMDEQFSDKPLQAALADPHRDVRWAATMALVRRDEPVGLQSLADELQASGRQDGDALATCLLDSGEPQPSDALTFALTRGPQGAKVEAIRLIEQAGGQAASPLLATALAGGELAVRRAAAAALLSIADPQTADALRAATFDPDGQVSRDARLALRRLGRPLASQPLPPVADWH